MSISKDTSLPALVANMADVLRAFMHDDAQGARYGDRWSQDEWERVATHVDGYAEQLRVIAEKCRASEGQDGAVDERPKAARGIYDKYRVERRDGTDRPGGKHAGCAYFVLDLTHDPYSMPALRAYAEACGDAYPALAADLRKIASEGQGIGGVIPTEQRDACQELGPVSPSPCLPAPDADVERVRELIVQLLRADTDALTRSDRSILLSAALDRLATRLAQQGLDLANFGTLAARAHEWCGDVINNDTPQRIVRALAKLARRGKHA